MDEEKEIIDDGIHSVGHSDPRTRCFKQNVKCKLAMLGTNEFYCQINEKQPMDPHSWMEFLYMVHQLCPTRDCL